jgi:membrane associated rhomboid family serine protease
MGLYDREYTQANYQPSHGRYQRPPIHFGMPRTASGWIILVNAVVFFICYMSSSVDLFFMRWFSVFPVTWKMTVFQPWRIITYQFLHGGFSHIFFNMLAVYFFGPVLERLWGPKKFLVFYLICGSAGGVLYPILTGIGWMVPAPLIGASGAIFGIISAAAILYPMANVYVLGVFPIKLMYLALILLAVSIMYTLKPEANAMEGYQTAHFAHLAGMVAGAAYVLWPRISVPYSLKSRTSPWQKTIQDQQQLSAQVDQILEKVYKEGINSLSRKEKNILKKATQLHQEMKK